MNRFFTSCFCICAALIFSAGFCHAQTKLQSPPAGVAIDGNIKEWGDSLSYCNKEKRLNYALANDPENLYVAIRIKDRSEQIRVLRAGLTLSIDTRGKKKESFTLTFPVGYQGQREQAQPANDLLGSGDVRQESRDDLMKARLTKLSQIRVTGFKDVESELITSSNTYGFKAAIDYDKDDNLIFEASIPLQLFHVNDGFKSEWAFNFKINGISRPGQNKGAGEEEGPSNSGRGGGFGGGGSGRGGRGGGRGGVRGVGNSTPADRSELSKSVDFWEKYYLNGK